MNLKAKLLTLAFALGTVFTAFAQKADAPAALPANGIKPTAKAFPPRNPNIVSATSNNRIKAALNQEKKKGLKVFGVTFNDYNRRRHFVNYYQNEYELEKLCWISREDEPGIDMTPDLHMVNAGAYNPEDGYYYAYKVKFYTIGITYAYQWLKVNPANGEWTVITELPNDMHNSTYLYDMAYSEYDGEMFGLVQNCDGQIKSRIGIINMDDSSLSDLVQLDEYYFAIAFDYDGNLYGIRWDYNSDGNVTGTRLDEFDADFKVVKSTEILVDGAAFKSYYQHGLDFDRTTGDLIWAATNNEGYQKMVRINPDTYETTNYGSVGYNEEMISLHVPYSVASHREAPAIVKDLSFTKDRNGSNKVKINWTNPTTMWNRKPLTDLASVKIYRDALTGAPIGTVNATGQEGKAMTFEDTDASQGVHTYYVVAVNAKGDGVPDSIEAYVGRDVPGAVTSLKVEAIDNGLGIKVSWGMPDNGDSEGWFDRNLTYDVERLPDHKMVAEGITATSYEDKNIEEAQFYSYIVTPINSDGRGTPLESEGLLAGASLKVPFSTHFENVDEANRFTSYDGTGFNHKIFEYVGNNAANDGSYAMRYLYMETNDVTLVSPSMSLTKGKKYRVDWEFTLCRYGKSFDEYTNHFRIFGGTAATLNDMSTVIADYPDFLSQKSTESFTISDYFESPVDGNYCVGFNIKTPHKYEEGWIYVTGFTIVESPDNDLAVNDLFTPKYVSADADNNFDVTVYNNGSNPQSNYTVEVGVSRLDGKFVPFATTTTVPTIEPHKSAVVKVSGKAAYSGVQDLMARVVLDGDGYAGNDCSDLKEVTFRSGSAFNYHADENNSRWTSGTLPFDFYYSHTGTQSIYTPKMLGFETETNVIDGLSWEYTSERDIDNIRLKVYLATTDKETYPSSGATFIRTNDTPVFDDVVSMEKGAHWLAVSFPGKPFNIRKNENLVVTVVMEESANNGTFPVQTNVFNSSDAGPTCSDNLFHTLHYSGNQAFDFNVKAYNNREIPVLHVSLNSNNNNTGIGNVTDAHPGKLGMRFSGNVLHISGNARTLYMYDFSGRLVCTLHVNGKSAVNVPVAAGMYVVKATDADNHITVAKLLKK